jgi:pimeloyl-ACP methyl ester carboxylesterase
MATINDLKSGHVKTNGQSLKYVEAGHGPLVLLLHGFPECWYSWRHQLPALAEAGYRAVALDLRGYGGSSKHSSVADYAITELVADCSGVVEALGDSTAVVVGHDWGAPIAWTAALIEPDRFHAVAGLSVPFAGRGLVGLPGDPFGEVRPSARARELAGPDRLFYHEYFNLEGSAEGEATQDLRKWLTGMLYSFSASRPMPDSLSGADLTSLPDAAIEGLLREAMCVERGAGLVSLMQFPEALPEWLTEQDLDLYVGEFGNGGLTAPLNYYRCLDRDWELLERHQYATIDVPSLFIGGDRDIVTIWTREARERASEALTDPRDNVIIPDCGHWIQQERPEETNAALLGFLDGL